MTISVYASRAHYWAHLEPIWEALPAEHRGQVWAPSGRAGWGRPPSRRELDGREPVMVAAYVDAQPMAGHPLVYVEHGAGQTYGGRAERNPSYSGGAGHVGAIMFICPGEHVAERWRAAYPSTPAVAVGCPRLDRWASAQGRKIPTGSTVALTWHWEAKVVPEMRSALRHYGSTLGTARATLRAAGVDVLGHSHPRAWPELERLYRRLGIEATPDAAEVFARADLLVADNTSLMYEAAAVGIPVLALNAPWYRRGVEHGLRFWSHVPGLQCDEPEQLVPMILRALADPPEAQVLRQRAVEHVYAATDGYAAKRAAQAIVEVLNRG